MKPFRIILASSAAAVLGLAPGSLAQTLFQDKFETPSALNYDLLVDHYAGSVTNDYTIDWAFDYSQSTYNFFTSATAEPDLRTVPLAPNSAPGESKGIKITVNKLDDLAERFAVNLYPKMAPASGDYVLKFDAFLSHGSFADSGIGTTEYLLFGLNHSGTNMNWGVTSGASMAGTFATSSVLAGKGSDGVWFQFVGDDGALRGFQSFVGNAGGVSTYLDGASGGVIDRDGNGLGDDDAGEPYLISAFPAPPFESPGVMGKRWLQVELSQVGNVLKWTIDGKVIAMRTNTSAWTSGRPMIGYVDNFTSIAGLKDETFLLIDNLRVERIRTVVVDTADNTSPAGDGKTSLAEALAGVQNNDRIHFNIPGAGPHYIVTPAAGYPLIGADNVVIDGYTQPGASRNTANVLSPNNAAIRIVLDSRAGGRTSLADFGSNGFGDSESAILPVFDGFNFTLRGVSVLSATGGDSGEDPFIYGVALIKGATQARIQGNWFGIDPANPTASGVRGGRAAVASFKWDNEITSEGLIVGTDSDGFGDVSEQNLLTGQLLAIHLETPDVRVSGNKFNYLPDNSLFNYAAVPGYLEDGRDFESFENGRGHYNLIGTDGNRVNDANERNLFGPVKYDVYAEFWRTATGAVIAGNYFGYGPAGTVLYTNQQPTAVAVVRSFSTLRVGSDFTGSAATAALEANYIAGLGAPVIRYHGGNANAAEPARVSFRGNVMSGNSGNAPIDPAGGLTAEKFLSLALADSTGATVPVIGSASTTNQLEVTVPARNPANVIEPISIEVYLADPTGLAATPASVQGLVFVKHVELDGTFDGGPLSIDISTNGISAADLRRVTVATSYKVVASPATDTTVAVPAAYVTTPFSATLGGFVPPSSPIRVAIAGAPTGVGLSWSGGSAPFQVQYRLLLDSPWQNLLSTSATNVTVPTTNGSSLFRVTSN